MINITKLSVIRLKRKLFFCSSVNIFNSNLKIKTSFLAENKSSKLPLINLIFFYAFFSKKPKIFFEITNTYDNKGNRTIEKNLFCFIKHFYQILHFLYPVFVFSKDNNTFKLLKHNQNFKTFYGFSFNSNQISTSFFNKNVYSFHNSNFNIFLISSKRVLNFFFFSLYLIYA